MPKRTNAFQKLVFHLKQVMAGNARVVESAMLRDRITDTQREVDVCVFCSVAGHEVCVAFECTDSARPVDVTWVEKMLAKHRDLPTDHLVLIAASGASEAAKRKAAHENIELITVEDVEGWGPGAVSQVEQVLFARTECSVVRATVIVRLPDGSETRIPGDPMSARAATYFRLGARPLEPDPTQVAEAFLSGYWRRPRL